MNSFTDLTNNLCGIFRKFVDQGKCTISFKLPEVDLQIKADAIQLKAFLNVMKNELCPKAASEKDDNKMIRAFASTNKMITDHVTKLTIAQRSDFPTKGFPRTLKELHIVGVGCLQMPIGVLNLTNLTHLNMSSNQITKIHKSLGNLRLTQLNIAENSISDWLWMNGKNLQCSLQTLNMSKNQLKGIPSTIACFENLVNLDLSFNQLERLPFAIQQMKQLRVLNLSNNQIKSLPSTISKLHLDAIDLSKNHFPSFKDLNTIQQRLHVRQRGFVNSIALPSLFELASRAVMRQKTIKIMHQNIPKIIKEILYFSPNCARCGDFCFDREIFQNIFITRINSKSRVTDNNESEFLAFGPLCSQRCFTLLIG